MSQSRNTSLAFSSRGQRMWRRNQNTVSFAHSTALGPITHTVLIALMIAVLGLIYLTQVTKTSYYGYQLDERQTKLDGLLAEKQNLEVENARLQALERVKNSSVAASLEAPASVDYATN